MMWSPQRYKSEGEKEGLPDSLLEDAIAQSEILLNSSYELPSILTLKHLAERTGVSQTQLRKFVGRRSEVAYERFSIRKRSGGRRFIKVPAPKLKQVQRWVHEHVLTPLPVHPASHAFKKGSSVRKCAAKHCGAQWLIKVDVADFFDSISEIQVYRVFRNLGYQPLIAFELARLCTIATHPQSPRKYYKNWRVHQPNKKISDYSQYLLGYVPQGAPTSPLLSNLVMYQCDIALAKLAEENGLTYTRYSDDLTFSTRNKGLGRAKCREIISKIYQMLSKEGFKPQFRKTKLISPGSKKIVLGLNVDGPEPRLQKEYKDRIKQHLYYLGKFTPGSHALARGFDSIWGLKCHLYGMIQYAKMIEPEYGVARMSEFSAVEWPV